MDIKIIRNKKDLMGTCYMELFPGRDIREPWGNESIFFEEETFGFLENIIQSRVKTYDHYAYTEIEKMIWLQIILDLENLQNLSGKDPLKDEFKNKIGFIFKDTEFEFFQDVEKNMQNFIQFLKDLVFWLKEKLKQHDAITILGI